MKTYSKRTEDILAKVDIERKKIRRKQSACVAGILTIALFVGVVLFTPYDENEYRAIAKYKDSSYYELITKLYEASYRGPSYNNNFEKWFVAPLSQLIPSFGGGNSNDINMALPEMDFEKVEGNLAGSSPIYGTTLDGIEMDEENLSSNGSTAIEDVTDNQVSGIIEGDRIKRSESHIYYLTEETLHIYSIAKKESTLVGSFPITDMNECKFRAYTDDWEMFLSEDANTVTLVSECFDYNSEKKFVALVSIDVSDPTNIKENGRTYLTGDYVSSRLVDGKILLISEFMIENNPDFSNEADYIPQYGAMQGLKSIPADNIIAPDELKSLSYTVICKIDEKTLEADDSLAFLSYTGDVYVSSDKIYTTRTYYTDEINANISTRHSATEIFAISYRGETLETLGSVSVNGIVKDQYSMDEYENVLRVVTTTDASIMTYPEGYDIETDEYQSMDMMVSFTSNENASLYCIDLSTFEIIASVENFAPEGESVQSVRFKGDEAYVCTALILSDPVFVFDLSDLNNITYKDTGTIDGYSFSLVDFKDGYLLGIGYGSGWNTMKIELYRQTETSVEPVCAYEVPESEFATEYKAYYINREKGYIGFGLTRYDNYYTVEGSRYVLLHFDGYDLVELVNVPLDGNNNLKRAVYIDGYLYMFGDGFAVEAL